MTLGRVERGLDKELSERPDIGHTERAALRSQARAIDAAEAVSDARLVTEANRVYLDLRRSAGLTSGSKPATDSFAELLAELGRPSPGGSYSTNA